MHDATVTAVAFLSVDNLPSGENSAAGYMDGNGDSQTNYMRRRCFAK